MLAHLLKAFRPSPARLRAHACYLALVEQARRPWFYASGGVPDTLDGRFETILLHLFLALRRLNAVPGSQPMQRLLAEVFFADMDRSVRELGVGDLGVARRVQRMAEAFYGRRHAYEEALQGGTLADALRRNLYGTAPDADPAALSAYIEDCADRLARLSDEAASALAFGWPLPGSGGSVRHCS